MAECYLSNVQESKIRLNSWLLHFVRIQSLLTKSKVNKRVITLPWPAIICYKIKSHFNNVLFPAGNESCPQPQTSEHLAAIEIMKLKHILILQNKIDLIKDSQARDQHEQVKTSRNFYLLNFVKHLSKPGGLDVETNRDRDRERPSCRD